MSATLIANNLKLVSTIWWMFKLKRRIERDPNRHRYMDQALTPVRDDDEETLDLLTKTAGAKAAIAHLKKIERAHPRRGRVGRARDGALDRHHPGPAAWRIDLHPP